MDGKLSEKGGNLGGSSEDPFTREEREKRERVEKNSSAAAEESAESRRDARREDFAADAADVGGAP
jgi:hypothetical protein